MRIGAWTLVALGLTAGCTAGPDEDKDDTDTVVDTEIVDTEIVDTEIVDTEIVDTEIVDTEVDTEVVDTEVDTEVDDTIDTDPLAGDSADDSAEETDTDTDDTLADDSADDSAGDSAETDSGDTFEDAESGDSDSADSSDETDSLGDTADDSAIDSAGDSADDTAVPPVPFTLEGTLFDGTTELPIAGAPVWLHGAVPAIETVTDASGHYMLDVQDGLHIVVANAPGYWGIATVAEVFGSSQQDLQLTSEAEVAGFGGLVGITPDLSKGLLVTDFNVDHTGGGQSVTITPAPSITGFTLSSTGTPTLSDVLLAGGEQFLAYINMTPTNYGIVPNGAPGIDDCTMRHPSFLSWPVMPNVMTQVGAICTGGGDTAVDSAPDTASDTGDGIGSIQGVVIDQTTLAPVVAAAVTLVGSNPPIATITNGLGEYDFDVPLGAYQILFEAPGYWGFYQNVTVDQEMYPVQRDSELLDDTTMFGFGFLAGIIPDPTKGMLAVSYDGTTVGGETAVLVPATYTGVLTINALDLPVAGTEILPGATDPILVFANNTPGSVVVAPVGAVGQTDCALRDPSSPSFEVFPHTITVADAECWLQVP